MLLIAVLCLFVMAGCTDASVVNHHREITQSKDELRCHCNLPVCVTTGYMCKSARGTCFSEIVDRADLTKSRHGCIELLTEQTECQNQPSRQHPSSNDDPERPLVLCCQDDLCNYGAQHAVRVNHPHHPQPHNHHRTNDSGLVPAMETRFSSSSFASSPSSSSSSSSSIEVATGGGHDLWLKAATIAVPIAGGCILVLLVLLAIRLLRRDRENAMDVVTTAKTDGYHHHYHSARQVQPQIHPWTAGYNGSKDRQPMLPGHQQQHHHHHIVYLPTVHKMVPSGKSRMWSKSIMAGKQQLPVHHV